MAAYLPQLWTIYNLSELKIVTYRLTHSTALPQEICFLLPITLTDTFHILSFVIAAQLVHLSISLLLDSKWDSLIAHFPSDASSDVRTAN
jgi:hypothetical protein